MAMIRQILALVILGGLLAGCGFQPLYKAESGAKQAVSVQKMAAIDIPPIQNRWQRRSIGWTCP